MYENNLEYSPVEHFKGFRKIKFTKPPKLPIKIPKPPIKIPKPPIKIPKPPIKIPKPPIKNS